MAPEKPNAAPEVKETLDLKALEGNLQDAVNLFLNANDNGNNEIRRPTQVFEFTGSNGTLEPKVKINPSEYPPLDDKPIGKMGVVDGYTVEIFRPRQGDKTSHGEVTIMLHEYTDGALNRGTGPAYENGLITITVLKDNGENGDIKISATQKRFISGKDVSNESGNIGEENTNEKFVKKLVEMTTTLFLDEVKQRNTKNTKGEFGDLSGTIQ